MQTVTRLMKLLVAAPLFGLALVSSATAWAQAPGGTRVTLCLVLPDIQLGQGVAAADPAGPVVSAMISYLSGPIADVQLLQARIPVQFNAEAAQRGCGFVVQSSVVHKKAGKGMSGLLAAAPSLMNAVPFMSSASGSSEMIATTMAASAAMEGVAAVQEQQAQDDAAAAMSGVAQTNIKKGDQITLTYKVIRAGSTTTAASGELKGKAEETGQDILSPLLATMANDVLTAALKPPG